MEENENRQERILDRWEHMLARQEHMLERMFDRQERMPERMFDRQRRVYSDLQKHMLKTSRFMFATGIGFVVVVVIVSVIVLWVMYSHISNLASEIRVIHGHISGVETEISIRKDYCRPKKISKIKIKRLVEEEGENIKSSPTLCLDNYDVYVECPCD